MLVLQEENDPYGSLEQVRGIVGQVLGPACALVVIHSGHTPHKEALEGLLHHAALFIHRLRAGWAGKA